MQGYYGLYVYDCAADGLNVTTLSLLDVEQCPNYMLEDIREEQEIQVLQQRETYDIHMFRCSVHYTYQITYCGMHSHSSRVRNGEGVGIWPVSPSECMQMHKTRTLNILGRTIIDLKLNVSDSRRIVLAGGADNSGNCQGSPLTIGDDTWNEVYATADISIVLHDFTGSHRVSDNVVVTPSGLTCPFVDGNCLDVETGFLTWDTTRRTGCDPTSYHVLYTGRSQKVTVLEQNSERVKYTLYSVKSGNFLATLIQQTKIEVCGMDMYTTDHSKILILEITKGVRYFKKDILPTKDMDLFLYVNAKFTHLEQHNRNELTRLYTTIMKETCEIKRHSLKTLLTVAAIDPVEFAYTYMGKPGYTGLLMGETINIVQCKPIYVTKATIDNCYLELPVNYSNRVYFMSPKSHILQKTGTPLTCSMFMQPNYKLENKWFASSNHLVLTKDPTIISVSMTPTWTYTNAGDLAKAGIYTEEDISRLRSQIMYPSERKAISQTISAAINQDSVISDTMIFKNLLTKEMVEDSITTFFGATWSHFVSIGTFFSGIFGLMLIFKLIKLFFDTIVNTRGLYEVYGFGWRLIAGIWDAATTYFLSPHHVMKHKEKRTKSCDQANPPPYNNDLQLQDVNVVSQKSEMTLYPTISAPFNDEDKDTSNVSEAAAILPHHASTNNTQVNHTSYSSRIKRTKK